MEFIIDHCPFLKRDDATIKYRSTDTGSFWITFLVVGAGAAFLLTNLSKVVDAAVKVKSHMVTVKQQEELLRSMELKNELVTGFLTTFNKINKQLTDQCVTELEENIQKTADGEEFDKAGMSLEKLALWMDKGLQIYSTIDASEEVKDLFPKQENTELISNEVLKLLEMKETATK